MRIIDHRQFQKAAAGKTRRARRWLRLSLWAIGGLFGLLVLANGLMWVAYRNRVLPNYRLGVAEVSNKSFAELSRQVTADALLPQRLTVSKDAVSITGSPTTWGVHTDVSKSIAQLKTHRSWLPLLSVVQHHQVQISVTINAQEFNAAIDTHRADFTKAAVSEHVVFSGSTFQIAPATNGFEPNNAGLQKALIETTQLGKTRLTMPTSVLIPAKPTLDLNSELKTLSRQLATLVSFVDASKTQKPTTAAVGSWYVASGETMAPSTDLIKAYVLQQSPSAANAVDAASATLYALTKSQNLNFRLTTGGTTYRYCVAQRGLDDGVLGDLRLKLAATYGDTRGWNNGGRVTFIAGQSNNCDFTVWLSAAEYMTSFGGDCDSTYSCRVGPNVVINYDRWRYATDPWNKAGLGVEDYRSLVINHETGHWLGFGHLACPSPGTAAPVMMQQSINLGGCTFNPWPITAELASL